MHFSKWTIHVVAVLAMCLAAPAAWAQSPAAEAPAPPAEQAVATEDVAQAAPGQSPVDLAISTEEVENQFIVSGLVGGSFGDELAEGGVALGGAFSYLWNGIVGPEFLIGSSPDVGISPGAPFSGDSSVDSYMANVMVAIPLSGTSTFDERIWQPYFSTGIGALNLRLDGADEDDDVSNLTDTQLGANAGGGLMGFWNEWGVRGDIRWFNGLDDDDDLDAADPLSPFSPLADLSFWRGNVGVSYRW